MARPGTGGSGGGFSGSRSGSSSSGGRSAGGSRPSGGSSSAGGSSFSGRSSSSGGGSFSARSSSAGGRSGGSSSAGKSSAFTDSSQHPRSHGGRTAGGSASQNRNNRRTYDSGFGDMDPRYGSYGYEYHYGRPYREPGLFHRLFHRRRYDGYHYQNSVYAKNIAGCGCLCFFIIPVLATALIIAFAPDSSIPSESKTAQFIETTTDSRIVKSEPKTKPKTIRIPLPPDKVNETEYYQDDLGWIEEPDILLRGLKKFHLETGVQPYLRLTAPVSGANTDAECDSFASGLYDELFADEGHFLLVYIENTDPDELGYLAYVCGRDAVTVIDDPAVHILYQYIDNYWFNEEYRTEEVFSNAFRDTALDLMQQSVTSGDWTNSESGWQFTDGSGTALRGTWAVINGIRYYFTADGYMATGWFERNGKWYYADENGACRTDTTTPDGYYVDENGVWSQ